MRPIVLPGILLAATGLLPGCVSAPPAPYYMPGSPYSGAQDHGARYGYGSLPAPAPVAPIPLVPAYLPPQALPAPAPLPALPTEPLAAEPPLPDPVAADPAMAAPGPQEPPPADDLPLPVPSGTAPSVRPDVRPATRANVPANSVPMMGFRPMRGQQGS